MLAYRPGQGFTHDTLAAIPAIGAFFCRTVGATVFVAWVADALLRKQYRRAMLRSALACLCVGTWLAYVRSVESSPEYSKPTYGYQRADYLFYNVSYAKNVSYIDPYRPERGKTSAWDFFNRFLTNVLAAPENVGEAITSYKTFMVLQVNALNRCIGFSLIPENFVPRFLIGIGFLSLSGIVLLLVRREWGIAIYVFVSVLVLCAISPWPAQQVRYLVPVVPSFLLGLVECVRSLSMRSGSTSRAWRTSWRLSTAVLMIVITSELLVNYCQVHKSFFKDVSVRNRLGLEVPYRQICYGNELIAMDEAVDWVGEHAATGDIVAASMPHWIYLRTGLKSVMPPLEVNPAKTMTLLRSVPVRFLLHETPAFFTWRYVDAAVRAYPDEWRLVHTARKDREAVFVYERAVKPVVAEP